MDAASVHPDVDVDENVDGDAGVDGGGGGVAQHALVVHGHAHRVRLLRERDQRGDLGGADDLIRDEHVLDPAVLRHSRQRERQGAKAREEGRAAADHEDLGLGELGAGHPNRASVDEHVRELRRADGLAVRAPDAVAPFQRRGVRADVVLQRLEVDEQRRRVHGLHRPPNQPRQRLCFLHRRFDRGLGGLGGGRLGCELRLLLRAGDRDGGLRMARDAPRLVGVRDGRQRRDGGADESSWCADDWLGGDRWAAALQRSRDGAQPARGRGHGCPEPEPEPQQRLCWSRRWTLDAGAGALR